MKTKKEAIIHVSFGKYANFYFGSLAAIYDVFTPEDLGICLTSLWNANIRPGHPYENEKCIISRDVVHRKKQRKI